MTDETPNPKPTDDTDAHGQHLNANEPVDEDSAEDVDAHARRKPIGGGPADDVDATKRRI